MKKEEARSTMKKLRREMDSKERKKQNALIKERLLQMPLLQETTAIYPFVSYGTEVDTISLIEELLEQKKQGRNLTVAVPKVKGKEMDFYVIESMDDLQSGYMGILEPVTDTIVTADHGIMIMPGLCFDHTGNRIGYGGGFYDRYLNQHDTGKLTTVAIAYDFQYIDEIEEEQHDRRPDYLLLPSQLIRF